MLGLAQRAALRHPPRLRPRLVLARRPDDLRDHVARSLDDHEVALADVLAADVVLVVERRARHGHAADVDGLELGERVEHAGAPDADVDLHEARDRRGRRPLEGAGEARAAVEGAEAPLLVERVDLDHDAVDLVAERRRAAPPRRRRRRRPRSSTRRAPPPDSCGSRARAATRAPPTASRARRRRGRRCRRRRSRAGARRSPPGSAGAASPRPRCGRSGRASCRPRAAPR